MTKRRICSLRNNRCSNVVGKTLPTGWKLRLPWTTKVRLHREVRRLDGTATKVDSRSLLPLHTLYCHPSFGLPTCAEPFLCLLLTAPTTATSGKCFFFGALWAYPHHYFFSLSFPSYPLHLGVLSFCCLAYAVLAAFVCIRTLFSTSCFLPTPTLLSHVLASIHFVLWVRLITQLSVVFGYDDRTFHYYLSRCPLLLLLLLQEPRRNVPIPS